MDVNMSILFKIFSIAVKHDKLRSRKIRGPSYIVKSLGVAHFSWHAYVKAGNF